MSSLNSLTSLSSIDDIYDPALSMTLPTPAELLNSSSNSNSGDQQGSILPPDAMLLASPRPLKNDFERACAYALNWCSPSLLIAGAELGLWLFADFALEVLGVQVSNRQGGEGRVGRRKVGGGWGGSGAVTVCGFRTGGAGRAGEIVGRRDSRQDGEEDGGGWGGAGACCLLILRCWFWARR